MNRETLPDLAMHFAETPIPEREFSRLETELLGYVKRRYRAKAEGILMALGLRLGALEAEQRMRKVFLEGLDGSVDKNL